MKKDFFIWFPLVILLGVTIFFFFKNQSEPKAEQTDETITLKGGVTIAPTQAMEKEEPTQDTTMKMQIDKSKTYIATIQTSEGDIKIELNAAQTPVTVNNFVTLAKKGFYNNTIFHRIIKGFMIQGGDPTGTGRGGPGYKFDDEKFEGEYTRGTLAMANAGPNTNGSQFFIMHKDNPLPKNYVIFGKVIEGIETVDKIAEAPTESSGMGENSKPVTPVTINRVEIVEE